MICVFMQKKYTEALVHKISIIRSSVIGFQRLVYVLTPMFEMEDYGPITL